MLTVTPIAPAPLARANVPAELPAGIAAPFLTSWQELDGADLLGAPVSPTVSVNGRLMQFFVYGALIAAPEGDGSTGAERYAVGQALADTTHDPERTAGGRRVGSDRGQAAFAVSAGAPFTVADELAETYGQYGGYERFGDVISAVYRSGNHLIQWFTYGRVILNLTDGSGRAAFDGWDLARALKVPASRQVSAVVPPVPEAIDDESAAVPMAIDYGFIPSRIEIPSIGVDAWVEQIGIVDGVMQTPEDAWNVGWYGDLASPGSAGNAVFAAHRDWWGIGPVVFYNLDQVSPGEQIIVTGPDGEVATYVITDIYAVPADSDFSGVIASDGDEEITLITCAGGFTGTEYVDRLIVRGVLQG